MGGCVLQICDCVLSLVQLSNSSISYSTVFLNYWAKTNLLKCGCDTFVENWFLNIFLKKWILLKIILNFISFWVIERRGAIKLSFFGIIFRQAIKLIFFSEFYLISFNRIAFKWCSRIIVINLRYVNSMRGVWW